MTTDESWEEWGRQNPYFGVLTQPQFRSHSFGEAEREEFFQSGRVHVKQILHRRSNTFGYTLRPVSVLDFGCGTGRTLMPFAENASNATGVDISRSMLTEAAKNCETSDVENVSFVLGDDRLSGLGDNRFDLVHTYIVLQHIPAKRALEIFKELVRHTSQEGLLVAHVLYGHESRRMTLRSRLSRFVPRPARRRVRLIAARAGRSDPSIEMNILGLDQVFAVLQKSGLSNLHVELTDHDSALGALIYANRGG